MHDMIKKIIAVFAALAAILPALAQEVDANLVDAVTSYSKGEFRKAESNLKTLSLSDPSNDAAWYYLALSQMRLGNAEGAAKSASKAVELDSTNFWYRMLQARIEASGQEQESAIALYEKLLKDFPRKSSALYDLLDLYLKNRMFEKALVALDQVEKQQGPSEELVRTRYDVYCAMGKQEDGISILEDFSRQYSLPSVLSILGDYYVADFQDSTALSKYNEALSIDSAYLPAMLGKAEAYRHLRRYDDYFATLGPFFESKDVPASTKGMYIGNLSRAIDPKIIQNHRAGFDSLVVKAAMAHPADSSVLQAAGVYYYSTGREAEAGGWFEKSADAFPESIAQTVIYIQYLQQSGQWEELKTRSLSAYDRFEQPAFLDFASLASYNLKDYDGIIDVSRHILQKYPSNKDLCLAAWSQLGDAYHSKGDSKNAYKAYEKALRIDSEYIPVLNNYAYYLSLEGKQLKKAYKMSKKTVEKEPDNATYLDTFGWILHLMGKDLEAKPFFKHAMLYGGKDSAVILRHYAVVLEALGEADNARYYRSMAAKLGEDEE